MCNKSEQVPPGSLSSNSKNSEQVMQHPLHQNVISHLTCVVTKKKKITCTLCADDHDMRGGSSERTLRLDHGTRAACHDHDDANKRADFIKPKRVSPQNSYEKIKFVSAAPPRSSKAA